MNTYLSSKLRVISFIAMLMVVFLHSNNMNTNFVSGNMRIDNGYSAFIQNYFVQGITRVAVPMFFCISGYLFFLNVYGRWSDFASKYRKRTKSLLLPYLLWSIWGIVFYWILQSLPQSRNFFTQGLVADYDYVKLLNRLFISPIPYQLWFIRDLLVMVAVSPIIYWGIKKLHILPVLLLLVCWLDCVVKVDLKIFTVESILFFCLGAFLAIHRKEFLLKIRNYSAYIAFILMWPLIVLLKTVLMSASYNDIIITLLHKLSILIGMVALWVFYDYYMKKRDAPGSRLLELSSYSFFLFAFHEPVLTLFKKALLYILGPSEIASLAVYFVAPILVICISLIVGRYLKKITPQFYSLITGGR